MISLTTLVILICAYFYHSKLDEIIYSDGSEEKFSIFCGSLPSASSTDFRFQPNIVTKLILAGKCVAESVGTYLNYTVANDDFAYGEYLCYQSGITRMSMSLLKKVKIIPSSDIFTSGTIKGRRRLLTGKTFNYICEASSQLLDANAIIKLTYEQKNQVVAKSKISYSRKANKKLRLQLQNSGDYLCSVTSHDVQSYHEAVYPKKTCTYTAKSFLEVYKPIKLEMAKKFSFKEDHNYAIVGANMHANWAFESMNWDLPTLKIDNVYVENGVLYIYKLNIKNYGTYRAISNGKTVDITIHYGEDGLVSVTQQSDSIDYYDESNNQADATPEPTSNGCKFMYPPSNPLSENFVGDSPEGTQSNCVSADCGKVYTLDLSSSFTYTCEGIGDSVKTMYFLKDGTKVNPSRLLKFSSTKWSALLEIAIVKMSDSGNYECVMEFMTKNSQQIIKKRIPFQIEIKPGS